MHAHYFSLFVAIALTNVAAAQTDAKAMLSALRAVGPEGKGGVEAAKAWQSLVKLGPDALPEVLGGLDDAGPLAANWIRSAAGAIVDGVKGKGLPIARLEALLADHKRSGAGRYLAFQFLVRDKAALRDKMLPTFLDDPGAELRRDAVAMVLKEAEKTLETNKAGATVKYQKALQHARDVDQVQLIAKQLKELGVEVDLTRQFGFVTQWHLVGPFNNVKGVGFGTSYPPEKGFNVKDEFESKDKAKLGWKEYTSDKPLGLVDLNDIYGRLKGAIVYGHAEIYSEREQPVELRAGSYNAVRISLNGKEVYFREEYHHGMTIDQHIGKGMLKAGKNEILIKVCQNEQTEAWAQSWSFMLRVCDNLGAAAPITLGKK